MPQVEMAHITLNSGQWMTSKHGFTQDHQVKTVVAQTPLSWIGHNRLREPARQQFCQRIFLYHQSCIEVRTRQGEKWLTKIHHPLGFIHLQLSQNLVQIR